jgi:TonB family protein
LRRVGIEGFVLVQFIVGKDGRVEPGSEQILAYSHDAFRAAVLSSLPNLRYEPALLNGRPTRQLVQQPFNFGPGQ